MQLSDIKGIGPKRIELLRQLHIKTPEDLLHFYPREYLDDTHCKTISELKEGDKETVCVRVLSDPTIFYHQRKYIVSARVGDETGKATLRWINQPYRLQQIHAGDVYYATATVNKKRGVVLYNPRISKERRGIIPIYQTVKGLPQSLIHDAVEAILETAEISEYLPETWLSRYRLVDCRQAIRSVHFPETTEDLQAAKRRLSFEEAFFYFTAMQNAKENRRISNGFSFDTKGLLSEFLQTVPFEPTEAQMRVMHEIEQDMSMPCSMNRLIQGDVGSGKTLIAEYALYAATRNGKQAVFLVPTEILAQQHYESLKARFPNACLYTGSMNKSDRTKALQRIENGDSNLVIGTHALLSDNVRFKDLGLVVTDEQHRFGVMQRAKIEEKGIRPDVLVMSATPIPRTLALLLYADLDLSVVDQLPKGRKPVHTFFVPSTRRKDLYRHLAENAKNGERSYVVCPLIEETEGFEGLSLYELQKELSILLPETSIGILHGQMPNDEKQKTMQAFRSGEISILISTTVIEVGVDVKAATSMVIEGADHFGLATLHQLRGRVGRGSLQSNCYLLSDHLAETGKLRIQAMLQYSDGFEIAQKDLEIRGMGDLFGVRQSGYGELSDILSGSTVEILELASLAAKEVRDLPDIQHNELLKRAEERFRYFDHIARN